ncbi:MAG TPA: asparagine synthase (glutamine-hydrolyzing) [Phycisphaerae bacterium]|nr:asparagine synthase (glutamine-hydrolyzing) [Phycisphaerae bacterium]HRY68042.1 asparagine synthase (glutamine-hydrolyzing) [Phycisphaerae bacterium]HSA28678.1 asparagine synthase (glutamine-hydrolyzing) [Phycisphaerae bacterium]
MCGIAGIIDFRGRAVDRQVLDHMETALSHRGPDDHGQWIHESPGFSVGLAHTRLAVIDPTPEGHQPMVSPDGRWAICYNGELYNFRELREQLSGLFHTTCDTEVALRACITWGPDALQRFDAMWAMAVVDVGERRGHLSRDPFGIKPLYYTVHDGQLVFASELRALRCHPGLPGEVDQDALIEYFNLGFVPHPRTLYRGICRLPPGHRLSFTATGVGEPERFYALPIPPKRPLPYSEACERIRVTIENAVDQQCVSDVPLGAFLSGGLDSAVVVAAMTRVGHRPVRTFSIGYPDHPRYDETEHARLVAAHFGAEHHEFPVTFGDVLAAVEPMLDHLGEPFADSSLLPTSLVSRYAREHVTVALSGDGGDELFGGYWRYLGHHYLERYRRWPSLVRKGFVEPLLRLAPSARTTRRLDRLRQVRKLLRGDREDPMARHIAWARFTTDGLAVKLFGRDRARAGFDGLVKRYREEAAALRPEPPLPPGLEEILLADLAVGLPGDMLHKVDTASMFHSLEVRVPLLAADVVQYATSLPVEYRIRGTTTKQILRDAFKDLLPASVLVRRKMGFEVPVGEFLRDELRTLYQDTVTPAALGRYGLDAPTAARLYEDHASRRADHTELLWALLVLCWRRG